VDRLGKKIAVIGIVVALGLALLEGMLAVLAWGLAHFSGDSVVQGGRGSILCVGDSCTEGIGAPNGRSYPDQLRALFAESGDPREVVNLGTAGFTTRQVLDRLEAVVAKARPAWVVFSGGHNDGARADILLEVKGGLRSPTAADRARTVLNHLRTYRLLEGAARVVLGKQPRTLLTRERSDRYPDPLEVSAENQARAFEEAAAAGAEPLFRWVVYYWSLEEPLLAERAFERFRQLPEFHSLRKDLMLPLEFYLWELRMLRGNVPLEPLQTSSTDVQAVAVAAFSRGYVALLEGRKEEARALFDQILASPWRCPWIEAYVRTHRAWIPLLERDFARADAELREVLPTLVGTSPWVALFHGLGGSALAHLLRDDGTRLSTWFQEFGTTWHDLEGWPHSPLGHEWMVAAEWVDAIKGRNPKAVEEIQTRARARFGTDPSTRPLAWLMRHPEAGFATVQRELPLELPRAAYLGARRLYWRWFTHAEVEGIVRPNLERLGALAKEAGFRPILMTYLDYQIESINHLLRRVAVEKGWPLIDFTGIYGVEKLRTDDKRLYFSPDRVHPNEAGYALEAQALFDRIRKLESGP
jgi:lysophospholipase L1-like esterase